MNFDKEKLRESWTAQLHRVQDIVGAQALPKYHQLGGSALVAVTDAQEILEKGLSCFCNERDRLCWLVDAVSIALHGSLHVAIPCSIHAPSSSPAAATAALSRAHVHGISFSVVQQSLLLYWELLEPCIRPWLHSPAATLAASPDLVLHVCYAGVTQPSDTSSTPSQDGMHVNYACLAPATAISPEVTQEALQALHSLVAFDSNMLSTTFTTGDPSRLQHLLQASWLNPCRHSCGVLTLQLALTWAAGPCMTCMIADAAIAELADAIVLDSHPGHKTALSFVMKAAPHLATLAIKHSHAAQAAELLLGAAALEAPPGGAVQLVNSICCAAADVSAEAWRAPTTLQSGLESGSVGCNGAHALERLFQADNTKLHLYFC
jgi:hypothetical protein